jgi:hypothetical protein
MKTRAIQLTVVMMMLTATMFAQSKKENKVWTSMTLKGTDKVEIRMLIPDDEVVVLNVYDETRKNVFTKRIKNENSLLLSHHISSFPNGAYTYEIKNGKKEVVSSTEIIKASGQDLVYKPLEGIAEADK